jgi:hypothetical protein
VHAAYINPAFTVGNILVVEAPMFKDNDGQLFDLSQVHSPWVDHSKLKLWYQTTLHALQKFRVNHDRSGKHEFDTDEGYQEFAHIFAADSKDICFLAGAARYRGDDALDFFLVNSLIMFQSVKVCHASASMMKIHKGVT